MAEETLGNPGSVITEECTLFSHSGEKVDLIAPTANYVAEINLFEDVWNKFLTGSIVIKDASNLITNMPIVGGEVLQLKLRTPTIEDNPANVIHKSFQITAIKDRSLNNDREQVYILNFCSAEMLSDASHILQQRFTGNTEEIATKIFEDYIVEARNLVDQDHSNTLFLGDTPHSSKISFVANNWTPTQALDFMSKYIKGKSGPGADFIFFESNKGMYYTSLQSLIARQQDVMFEEYLYTQSGLDIQRRSVGSYFGTSFPKGWVTIEKMKIPKTVDMIRGQMSGYYAQTIRAYDLFTKDRYEAKLDVVNDFDTFVHTEPGIPVPPGAVRNPYSMTTLKLLNSANNITQTFNIPGSKGGNSDNENVIAADLLRDNYFNSLNDYCFEIDVPGRTDIEVGMMIYISYPTPSSKTQDLDFDDLFDRQLSGKYLITAIRHKIDTAGYVMKMEIIKNGLPESVSEPEEE